MAPHESRHGVLGAAITFGFATTVAMWCVWWVAHHPAVALAPTVAGPLILGVMGLGMVLAGRATDRPLVTGAIAGGISAALSVLILGSLIARPPDSGAVPRPGFEGTPPNALLAVLGFLVLGVAVGAAGGLIGRALRRAPSPTVPVDEPRPVLRRWLAHFAVVACVSVFPLLVLGGAVTSTGSGMAVPGWPDSYGANMFLYPISLMSNQRVFLEHTHRLMGALVGLTTITMTVWTLASPSVARWIKTWAVLAAALVIAQGVFGGLRVIQSSTGLAFVHGVTSQLFLAIMVCVATFLSPWYDLAAQQTAAPVDRKRRAFSMGLQHSTLVQLLLGAAYRHFGQASGNNHALWAHAAFSLVVVGMATAAGFALRTREPRDTPINRHLRLIGTAILAVVALQFMLGWATFVAVLQAGPRGQAPRSGELAAAPPADTITAVTATIHQVNGALLLALATGAVVLTRRIWKSAGASRGPTTADAPR